MTIILLNSVVLNFFASKSFVTNAFVRVFCNVGKFLKRFKKRERGAFGVAYSTNI